ncbi:MAG: Ldh family oxidoreductase [Bradyrhizobium sp.]|uniref:Ldh family oxidoreductase n=1 Tax=Bradyrhizobium sp. TaxID=376 RepID=UPI001D44949D|nr:Ldh family oxidoreductase [Bradyrhizobium sp.]MBV9561925.1 Ldh family oxidoreductase [Bradyrhizobium sp.]
MSPAVAARGKIRRAARCGQSIPLGYALDAKGRQTTDPNVALDGGTVQPIGGPKGSALAMLMDVIGGVISGAAFGGEVRNHFEDYEAPQNVRHFVMAIKPDLFVSREEYTRRMVTLVQRVHADPTAEGFDEVIMPGERERRPRGQTSPHRGAVPRQRDGRVAGRGCQGRAATAAGFR